jgi:hypothetical protein
MREHPSGKGAAPGLGDIAGLVRQKTCGCAWARGLQRGRLFSDLSRFWSQHRDSGCPTTMFPPPPDSQKQIPGTHEGRLSDKSTWWASVLQNDRIRREAPAADNRLEVEGQIRLLRSNPLRLGTQPSLTLYWL